MIILLLDYPNCWPIVKCAGFWANWAGIEHRSIQILNAQKNMTTHLQYYYKCFYMLK